MRFSFVFSLIFKNRIFFPNTSSLMKNVFFVYFKSQISKCPDLCEILPPVSAHQMLPGQTNKLFVYFSSQETPCIYKFQSKICALTYKLQFTWLCLSVVPVLGILRSQSYSLSSSWEWAPGEATPCRTRLSYYNVTTRLVDLVVLCWLKQNLVEKNMLCYHLMVDLDYFVSLGFVRWNKMYLNKYVEIVVRLGFDNSGSFLMC